MKINYLLITFLSLAIIAGCKEKKAFIESPDSKISVNINVDSTGVIVYSVFNNDSLVLENSTLGIVLSGASFTSNLKIDEQSKIESVSDSYSVKSEKRSECKYDANKRSIIVSNNEGQKLRIVFQVSNNGLAFRYELLGNAGDTANVLSEISSFNFPQSAKAWLHPHTDAQTGWNNDQPSYEENYKQDIPVGTEAPCKAGWSYPALFKSGGSWVLITESGVDRNYCGSRLSAFSPDGDYTVTYPQLFERTDSFASTYPKSVLPMVTPWRIIMIGSTLAPIVESTLVTDLSIPNRLSDTTFVKPGKASWSWVLYKDDSTVFETQKRFIDYAASMNWEYCLVDGYWDTKIGYEKLAELAKYAISKNVGLLLWYNSAGSWNTTPITPRNLMYNKEIRCKEFEKISAMGFKGVKIDFFGGDGQSFMAYYQDLLLDAAKYKLVVNFHGASVPRGWTRTYPNLVSTEAVKGFEFITFEQANTDLEPNHCTMLPFTRNIVGPMDFTPMCFSEIPNLKRITTNGFELALSVVFQSGVQHYAEVPPGMAAQPEYVKEFLRNLPSQWNDIKFMEGFPGQYVVLARKGKGHWYVAGINGENKELDVNIDLSVLGEFKTATLITDKEDNRKFTKEDIKSNKVALKLMPYGGFVISLN